MQRQRILLFVVSGLAVAWASTMTAIVVSLAMEQREHAHALGLICGKPRHRLLSVIPFVRKRGACEAHDEDLPPALQRALPFLKPLKKRILALPLIGAAATYAISILPIAGPYAHFLGVSLTRYIMPCAKKVEALFLVLKLSKQGQSLGVIRWLRRV